MGKSKNSRKGINNSSLKQKYRKKINRDTRHMIRLDANNLNPNMGVDIRYSSTTRGKIHCLKYYI